MPRFSIRNPYLIVVIALVLLVVGAMSLTRMPVDLFPTINLPEVVVATFYAGMPPQDVENIITSRFERFFTLGSGIDHMESRSLPGVSIIKIFFQAGTNADADTTEISNLAMADLGRLPQGTLPPVVMKFDASSLPVALVTLQGQGLTETQLRDDGQFAVRDQLAVVPGASVPLPFGGKYRQIMVYTDPLKLQAFDLSPMDVVHAVNSSNLILPAGDAKIGPYDYNIYTNSQLSTVNEINEVPLKTVGNRIVRVQDVGEAEDSHTIQTNVVMVNGQRSAYLPIMKQGGDTNTIAVVEGVRHVLAHLYDVPKSLVTTVAFDQSAFVKEAIDNLLHEGGVGLFLTALMVLVFLGSLRATVAVSLAVPLSALTAFIALDLGGSSINTMILAGLALAFSRMIDNSVIVLENIFRHMEMGEPPAEAAAEGGQEVAAAVLAATLTTCIVFFPVTFLYGVARFLFSALALAVVLSLAASYFVALTVVPLFCARFIKPHAIGQHASPADTEAADGYIPAAAAPAGAGWGAEFNRWFNRNFDGMLESYESAVRRAMRRPRSTVAAISGLFVVSLGLYPLLGVAFFPRTDAGQFVMNLKAKPGTRVELMTQEVQRVQQLVRKTVAPGDLQMIVSNIGINPDFTSIYTSNSGPYTATVQVELTENHKVGSYTYMDEMRRELRDQVPELTAFFQSGGMEDAILNQGAPAPIDVQVSGNSLDADDATAKELAQSIRSLPNVSDVYIPQDLDYPALNLDVNRQHASELGLSQQDVIDNVITALTSNTMIAPSYWIDPQTGDDYMLTVQYPEQQITSLNSLRGIALHASDPTGTSDPNAQDPDRIINSAAERLNNRMGLGGGTTELDQVATITRLNSPTEVDHYQIQREFDVYVNPATEDLGGVASKIRAILAKQTLPVGVTVTLRGMVESMYASFESFGLGLILAMVLLYLILVAQFRSFIDPILILLAVPTGVTGVLAILVCTNTTLNVMSLMGVIMMVGIVVSNSILIVEFAHRLEERGRTAFEAAIESCRIRLRPILMTSLATIIGLLPLALKLGTGSEAYTPLARAIIGGLLVSVVLTVFIVPAAYVVVYGGRPRPAAAEETR